MPDLVSHPSLSYHRKRSVVKMTTGRFAESKPFPSTCREVYERYWRGQIERLLQDPDDHATALLGMVACMELAFLCKMSLPLHPKNSKNYSRPAHIIEEFFPKEIFPYARELGTKMTNGLKHNSYIRKGVGLLDTLNGLPIPEPIEKEDNLIWVAPTAFWNHIKPQIEEIYENHDRPYDTYPQ